MKYRFLLLIHIFLVAPSMADAVPGGKLIGRVWSGHPVNFDHWDFRWDFSGHGSQDRILTLGAPSPADGGDQWILRWETLALNRDLQYREAPPPCELRPYQFPGSGAKQDAHPV